MLKKSVDIARLCLLLTFYRAIFLRGRLELSGILYAVDINGYNYFSLVLSRNQARGCYKNLSWTAYSNLRGNNGW